MADLRGIARLARALATGALPLAGPARAARARRRCPWPGVPAGLPGQLLRFAAVGIAQHARLPAAVRRCCAATTGAQAANLVALLLTAVANTAANRRLTFGVRGPGRWWRQQAQGLIVFAVGLALTSGALALLHATDSAPPRPLELGVLVTANLAATCVRFLLLRTWVFRTSREAREN